MTGLARMTLIELKLLLRDWVSLLFPLALPLFVLLIFGMSFDASDPTLPSMSVAIALALNALYSVPAYLGTYREQGVLRRLSTTPVHPATLLIAQLALQIITTAAAMALVLVVAGVALDIAAPRNPAGALPVFVLGIGAMFAIGCLIAALAPNGRAASGIGVLLYFPMAFLGGVTVPREQMPRIVARIGDWTPLGAFRQAVQDTWSGAAPAPLHLGIMALYAIVIGALAARFFRWE